VDQSAGAARRPVGRRVFASGARARAFKEASVATDVIGVRFRKQVMAELMDAKD